MYLSGLLHRDRIHDIVTRWYCDELQPGDARELSEIFLYESLVTGAMIQRLLAGWLPRFGHETVCYQNLRTKDELRECLISNLPSTTPRIEGLVARYRESPEEYFPHLPVDAVYIHDARGRPVAISRVKRIRRVAEKASRRMSEALSDRINEEAQSLAARRAVGIGVMLDSLVSSPQQMAADFVAAEREVARGFQRGELHMGKDELRINDIVGFKVIGTSDELGCAEDAIAAEPGVHIVERQVHRGRYNATNLLVDVTMPPVGELVADAERVDWSSARSRGLDPEATCRDFPRFLEAGASTIRVEVILTTFEELMESEFGRSLHEERIVRLRDRESYRGRIAENARMLLEYVFHIAFSPAVSVTALPIKLWGRYLPDSVLHAIRQLYGEDQFGVLNRHLLQQGTWSFANRTADGRGRSPGVTLQ